MNRRVIPVSALVVALTVIAGCAGTPPPPTLDLSTRNCTLRPELQRAIVLSFQKENEHTTNIDDKAPCIVVGPGDARSAYSIFSLPSAAIPYLVTVTSTPIGQGLFSPHLLLLDAEGIVLRELPRDSFQFHGSSLYAGVRVRSKERYLVVASDPQHVGEMESQIASSVQSGYVSGGVISFMMFTGSEATNQLTYAHNGKITVELKTLKP